MNGSLSFLVRAGVATLLLLATSCAPIIFEDHRNGQVFDVTVSPPQKNGLIILILEKERGMTAAHTPESWERVRTTRPVWVHDIRDPRFEYPEATNIVWFSPILIGYGFWNAYALMVLSPGMKPGYSSLYEAQNSESGAFRHVQVTLKAYETPALWLERLEELHCGLLLGNCGSWQANSLDQEKRRMLTGFLCAEASALKTITPAMTGLVREFRARVPCDALAP